MNSVTLMLAIASTACPGIKQYTRLSYVNKNDASATSKEEGKNGAELLHGVESEEVGDHRIGVGFYYQSLPDTESRRIVTIDPDDYREGPPKNNYLFEEELITKTTDRALIDLSFSLERRMFLLTYATNDIEWLQWSGLLGAGLDVSLISGNTTEYLAENKVMSLPELELESMKGFGEASLELKLGKQPYLIIPLQWTFRISHDEVVHYSNLFKVGYEIQWGGGDK